jgi:hypothetical protein
MEYPKHLISMQISQLLYVSFDGNIPHDAAWPGFKDRYRQETGAGCRPGIVTACEKQQGDV